MWKIIGFILRNRAAKIFFLNVIRFSKDGYTKEEIVQLISDLLMIFGIPVSISYRGKEIEIKFTWK